MERGVASRGARLVTARPGRPWDPARRALGPGWEELAGTDPDASPVREARPRAQNRHGGAPRGGRPSHKGRKAPHKRLACPNTPTGCFARVPVRLSVLRPPLIPGERSEKQNPGAETRRGNEEVLFEAKAFSWSFRPRRDSGEGRNP